MNALQKYFNYRQALIDQYIKGDMTKREYLQRNLDAVLSLGIKPFKHIDNIDKGLFNYQYYNALAKDASMAARSVDSENALIYNEKCSYYYSKKDKATMKILELAEFKDVEAYIIRVRSKELKNKLFEIILENKNMVLHSMNPAILNKVKEEGVFTEGTRKSVIDGYINHRY